MTSTNNPASRNVFEDLGFSPDEAENLRIRSTLMVAIKRVIRARGLKQTAAAELFGTTQPRISDLMRGHINEFTIDSLVNMLGHAGIHPKIHVPMEIA